MIRDSLHVFLQLLKRDLLVFRRVYINKLIDTLIFFVTSVVIFAYIMPFEGLGLSYGAFIVISGIGSFGLTEVVGKVGILMADLEGDQTITNTLVMPIRSGYVFLATAVSWALTSLLLALPLFPVGKLLLYHRLPFTDTSWWRLSFSFVSVSLFYGFFSLWLTSVIRGMSDLNTLWSRVIGPIWMFGAYFYPWAASYEFSPLFAYVSLMNPMVFAMEGIHAAALGQEGYLPFWLCMVAIWGWIGACGFDAVRRLRRRLDCV